MALWIKDGKTKYYKAILPASIPYTGKENKK